MFAELTKRAWPMDAAQHDVTKRVRIEVRSDPPERLRGIDGIDPTFDLYFQPGTKLNAGLLIGPNINEELGDPPLIVVLTVRPREDQVLAQRCPELFFVSINESLLGRAQDTRARVQ